jgi:hypothetical protein
LLVGIGVLIALEVKNDFSIPNYNGIGIGTGSIAFGGDTYLMAYRTGPSGNYVRGRFISLNGASGADFEISDSDSTEMMQVAYHPASGKWCAIWTQSGSPNANTYGRIFEHNGTSVTAPFAISTNGSTWPHIVATADKFFVAYETNEDIYGRFVGLDGSLGTEFIISNAPERQTQPRLSYSPDSDKILVAFTDFSAKLELIDYESDIEGQIIDGKGNLIGGKFVISATLRDGPQSWPRIAYSLTNKTFLVTWDDNNDYPYPQPYGQRVTVNETLVGDSFKINSGTTYAGYAEIVYSSVIDKYFVLWTDVAENYCRLVSSDGIPLGSDLQITYPGDNGGSWTGSDIAIGLGGQFLLIDFGAVDYTDYHGWFIGESPPSYIPDAYIKNIGEANMLYTFRGEIGNIAFQTKKQSITDTNKAIYYITIEQEGANNDDTISVTGTGNSSAGGGNWTVKYYEVTSESDSGIDRTSEIVSGYGYALASGGKQLIRSEVTPDTNVISGTSYTITVTATSTMDSSKRDTVRAITTAIGGWQFVGSNFQITTDPSKDGYINATFGGNKYLVIWSSTRTGTNRNMFGKFIGADGSIIGSDFAIDAYDSFQQLSAVKYNPYAEKWLVVWTDDRVEGSPYLADIYGRLINKDGSFDGDSFVITAMPEVQSNPTIAALPGKFLIVWQDGRDEETIGVEHVYARMIDSNGTLLGSEIIISNEPASQAGNPDAAYDPVNDRVLVVWEDWRNEFVTGADIYARFIGSDGSYIGEQFIANDDTGNQQMPSIAYNSKDGSYLVTNDGITDSTRNIRAQKLSANGSKEGSSYQVNDGSLWYWVFQDAKVAYNLVINGYLIVWADDQASPDNSMDVFGQIINGDGTKNGNNFLVTIVPNSQSSPAIAAGPDRDFLVVWNDDRGGGNGDVWGQIVSGPPPLYLPDAYIKNAGENDTLYAGGNTYYTSNITLQTKEQSITDTNKAIYYITIEQDGVNNDDIISVTGIGNGSTGGGNWTVKYYAVTNESDPGIDRTSEIVSGYGYALISGGKQLIRAEVIPDINVISGTSYAITITATSTLGSSRNDVVRAITTSIEDEETITGSSGENGESKHHKHKTWYKCGYLGIEPFILLGIVWLMRKRRTKRN